jgi:general secretion pathway protein K
MSASAEAAAGRRQRQRGFALVAVLWMLVLLAFLATSYSTSTRTGAFLTRNLEEGAKAEALADAAIHRALWELLRFDADPALRTDGTVYEWAFAGGVARFAIHDEAGKVDVNAASEELLESLFVGVGLDAPSARGLAEAIASFHDGGEAGPDTPFPQQGVFRTVDDVQRVPGMSAAVFARIRPLITVYTGMMEPDLAVAPPAVRAAMTALPADAAEDGDAFRPFPPVPEAGAPEADAPGADADGEGPFRIVGGGEREGAEGPPGGAAFPAEIVAIHAEARLSSGAVFAREAVADLRWAEDPYRFFVWRQARRQLFPLERPGRES